MKIVIVQGAFLPVPPLQGGAVEKIWYRMGQEFAAAGHEVVHISKTYAGLPVRETYKGVEYIRVAGYETPSGLLKLKFLDLLYSLRALKKLPKDAGVIVTNTFWAPLLLRGAKGKKVYVSVERFPRGQMKFYRHAGRLRACSPSIYEAVKKEIALRHHALVTHVPNPVPFDVVPVARQKTKTILFVGRLHPEKGLHVLLEAFALLEKKIGTEWKLVIVGPHEVSEGGGGETYHQKLLALANGCNVKFIGAVYNEKELIDHYASAAIFCYPAQDGSGDAAPVAPREAMAYGCVPVVSQLDCFNDFIQDGFNGLRYNQKAVNQPEALAEALQSLMSNPAFLTHLSLQAKQVYETYSAPVIAQHFIRDFSEMIRHENTQRQLAL